MNTFVQGKHKCYVCESEIQWQANLNGRTATYAPYTVAHVIAVGNETVVGKDVEGVVLEVVTRCRSCETQNKFTHQHYLLDEEQ